MATTSRTSGRQVVRYIDPRSAAKVAFALTATLSAIVIVGLAALFLLGMASGALASFEGFIESFGWEDFRLRFFRFVPVLVLVGLAASAVVTVLVTAGAVIYNALSDVVGGIEVTTRDR